MKTHIAPDYIDENGERVTGYHLMNEENYSVAYFHMKGLHPYGFNGVVSMYEEANQWADQLIRERREFLKTPLVVNDTCPVPSRS